MSLNTNNPTTKQYVVSTAAANAVSPNVPREIMDNKKVQRIANTASSDHNQVLSAVEALLSLSPVVHQEEAATSKAATVVSTDQIVNLPYMPKPPSGTVSPCDSSVGSHEETTSAKSFHEENEEVQYFEGSCELWCPEDEECLSPLHCFMRKYCVEAFTAKAFDVSTPKFGRSLGRSIEIGQLGVQCKWCKHRNYSERQERAVCFPSTIKNIYHSIETWQRRHSTVCQDIPDWAKKEMTKLMECSRSGAGGRRLYWEESAKRMGMVDTDSGVRFIRPPGTVDPPEPKQVVEDVPESKPVVSEEDSDLQITGYLFHLLNQMETCYFSEEDRIGGRSKVKSCRSGYPGLQCKHCNGKSGFGRYFPASCAALSSANSDRNIFNHLSKCRKCPQEVRDELSSLFKQQNKFKNRRGTRKVLFQRIWCRMHNVEAPEDVKTEAEADEVMAAPKESEADVDNEQTDEEEEEFIVSTKNIRELAAATHKQEFPTARQEPSDQQAFKAPTRNIREFAMATQNSQELSTAIQEPSNQHDLTVSARKIREFAATTQNPQNFAATRTQEFTTAANQKDFVVAQQQQQGFPSVRQQQHDFFAAQQQQLVAQRRRQHLAAQQLAAQHHRRQMTAQQLASQHRQQHLALSDQHHRPVMLQHQSLLMQGHPQFAVPPYVQQHQQRYMTHPPQQRAPHTMYMDPNFRLAKDVTNSTSV